MAYTPEKGRRFWFDLDRATQYNAEFMKIFLRSGARDVQNDFRSTRNNGTYPAAFKEKFLLRRDDWVRMANVQTSTVISAFATDWSDIQAAFEDFGQGTLLETDPERQAAGDSIHMMDGQTNRTLVGYHRWHASIRLIQLLKIGDPAWWENLDRLVGLAWGVQSFARPQQQNRPNPAIGQSDLEDLRNAWLPLPPDRRDRQYDLTPQAVGFHPSPKQPVSSDGRPELPPSA